MQAVSVVVLRQLYFFAVDGDFALVDAVGISAYGGAEVAMYVLIVLNAIESEHHVAHHTVSVGNQHRGYASAEIGDAHLHAVGIGEHVECSGIVVVGARFEVVGEKS